MKKSELKQLIKEVIKESLSDGIDLIVFDFHKLKNKPDIQTILNTNKIKGLVGYDHNKDAVINNIEKTEVEKVKKLLGRFGLFSFIEQ